MPPAPAYAAVAGDAVIVEPRPLRRLPVVARNVWDQLPQDAWTMHILHGQHVQSRLRHAEEVRPVVASGRLRLLPLARLLDSIGIVSTSSSRKWYNAMLLNSAFWRSFRAPLLLLFEADTALCPSPRWPLHAFAGFGYVGAPWAPYSDNRFPHWCRNLGSCVGNSGLSLWSRPTMENVTARPPSAYEAIVAEYLSVPKGVATKRGVGSVRALYERRANLSFSDKLIDHIDVWASVLLQSLEHAGALPVALPGGAVPPSTVAARFSVETLYTTKADAWVPVGVHKPHAYLPSAHVQRLYERCKPAQELAWWMNESLSGPLLWEL